MPKVFPIYGNESTFQEIRKARFGKIEFLDFSKFPLKTCEFGDLEHVNQDGAKKFSIWFDQIIKEGLLTQKNKQQFIDSSMNSIGSKSSSTKLFVVH